MKKERLIGNRHWNLTKSSSPLTHCAARREKYSNLHLPHTHMRNLSGDKSDVINTHTEYQSNCSYLTQWGSVCRRICAQSSSNLVENFFRQPFDWIQYYLPHTVDERKCDSFYGYALLIPLRFASCIVWLRINFFFVFFVFVLFKKID